MKPIVVLDACTILNLLRIDDETDFLMKQLKSWTLCLPQTVYNETKLHVRSENYPPEKNDHILFVINTEFDHRKTLDADIKNDLDEEFDRLLTFSKHDKRENGELYCVALALVKSRCEEDVVTIYTDDYKATEEFRDFYRYHRIGDIGDTLDLLTLLYWTTSEETFQRTAYQSFLENLRAEYCHQLKEITDSIEAYLEKQKNNRCNDKNLLENLGKIVAGYRRPDMSQMESGIRFFQEGSRYKDVKKIVDSVDVGNVNRQMERITEHFKRMKDYPLFKVA